MPLTVDYLWWVILVMGLATFITRSLPFVFLSKQAQRPALIYLGRYLPPMLMMILLIYTFKDEVLLSLGFVPELLGLILTVGLHLLWRKTLVSILGGTGLYMFLLQSNILNLT